MAVAGWRTWETASPPHAAGNSFAGPNPWSGLPLPPVSRHATPEEKGRKCCSPGTRGGLVLVDYACTVCTRFVKSCLPQSVRLKLAFQPSVTPNAIMLDALATQGAASFQPKLNPRSLVLAERCRLREESTSQSQEQTSTPPSNGENACLVPSTMFPGQQHSRNDIPYPITTRRPSV